MSSIVTSIIAAIINGDVANLRSTIHLDLVRMTAQRLGYNFLTEERLKRISDESMAMMDNLHLPFPYAFDEALWNELMMYGDPRIKDNNPKGNSELSTFEDQQ